LTGAILTHFVITSPIKPIVMAVHFPIGWCEHWHHLATLCYDHSDSDYCWCSAIFVPSSANRKVAE